jgi:hypothetical protein
MLKTIHTKAASFGSLSQKLSTYYLKIYLYMEASQLLLIIFIFFPWIFSVSITFLFNDNKQNMWSQVL